MVVNIETHNRTMCKQWEILEHSGLMHNVYHTSPLKVRRSGQKRGQKEPGSKRSEPEVVADLKGTAFSGHNGVDTRMNSQTLCQHM